MGGLDKILLDVDISLEVIAFSFGGGLVDISLGEIEVGLSEISDFLCTDGLDLSDEGIVVIFRDNFTFSVIFVGVLDSLEDGLELDDDGREFLSVELSGKLNESLNRVGLRDSVEGVGDFAGRDFEERATTLSEVLELLDDGLDGADGVLIAEFTSAVGLHIAVTSFVDEGFTLFE